MEEVKASLAKVVIGSPSPQEGTDKGVGRREVAEEERRGVAEEK